MEENEELEQNLGLEENEELYEDEEQEIEELEDIEEIEETSEDEELDDEADSEEVENDEEEEEYFEEQYERTKPIGKLIMLVAFTAIMLVSSTYAWFSAQKSVTIGNLEGKVNVAEGLEVSLDAEHWSNEIDLSKYTDQNDLKQLYGSTEHNIIPSEMLPVSTIAKEAIDETDITMYRGINREEIKLSGVEATSNSVTSVSDNKYPGYYAIDIFLRNSSRIRELDPDDPDDEYTEEDLYEVLQLNADSMVNVVSSGADITGLQNTVRVALALYTSTENGDTASVGMTANQSQILAATTGASATIRDIAIWEPNASDHVEYIVSNNNKLVNGTDTATDLQLDKTYGD